MTRQVWIVVIAVALAAGCEKHSRHGGDPTAASGNRADGGVLASDPLPIGADLGTILQQRISRVDATHFVVEPYELSMLVRLAMPVPPGAFTPSQATRTRYGLEPDDVVVSANGVSSSTPQDILAAVAAARQKGSVTLLIERKSTELAIEYRARVPMPDADLDSGIGRRDDQHYEITRRFLVRVLRDPTVIARQGLIVPGFRPAGGFRVYASRSNTVWARLGLLSGDNVTTVNGHSFEQLTATSAALDELRRARVFTLAVTRRLQQQPIKVEWEVVESLSPAAIAGQHLLPTRPPSTALGSLLGSSNLSSLGSLSAPGSSSLGVGTGFSGLGLPPPPQVAAPDPLLDSQIKRIDATHFEIKKTLVDLVASDSQIVMRSLRIMPSQVNGKPNGFKLFAIPATGLASRLGLLNGDTVNSVNGLDVSQPGLVARAAVVKLKTARKVNLGLVRRGSQIELEWTIVR